MKICTNCKKEKNLTEFKKTLSGDPQKMCINCNTKRNNRSYREKARSHGMSFEEFNKIMTEQDSRCAICQRDIEMKAHTKRSAVVDHDHNCCPKAYSCGKCIRGLLCTSCNVGIGMFKDNPHLVFAAAKYLLSNFYKETERTEINLESLLLSYEIV